MQTTPWYKKSEMLIGLSALAVSLVAMFSGIYSAYLDRSFARASVWPKVEVRSIYSTLQQRFIYQVENVGTGPAQIKYTKVSQDDRIIRRWAELARLTDQPAKFSEDGIRQRVLPALASFRPLVTEDAGLAQALNDAKYTTTIEICYCSVFDDCWLTNLDNQPRPVAQCTIADDERFLN